MSRNDFYILENGAGVVEGGTGAEGLKMWKRKWNWGSDVGEFVAFKRFAPRQ